MTSVSIVANVNPKIMVQAIGAHHSEDSDPICRDKDAKSKLIPNAIGNKPITVVIAVKRTGLKRVKLAFKIESSTTDASGSLALI